MIMSIYCNIDLKLRGDERKDWSPAGVDTSMIYIIQALHVVANVFLSKKSNR